MRFFLDGSRRTYKVADIILNGRYLPLVAGQAGVAVVSRNPATGEIAPMRRMCKVVSVLAFPETANDSELAELESRINSRRNVGLKVLQYSVKQDRDPVDLGVARIMKHMQDLEVETVNQLSLGNHLNNDALLVVDGPLRFKEMRGRDFDIIQFRNVIGLSKTFRPSYAVSKKRQRVDVGALCSALSFRERTSVLRTTDDERVIGMWYLRLRQKEMMTDPLQGVVKLECYAVDEREREAGFARERVDVISAHLLRERNVTPYGADWRWANHIYPVYLAESYIKASFMSDTHFLALF